MNDNLVLQQDTPSSARQVLDSSVSFELLRQPPTTAPNPVQETTTPRALVSWADLSRRPVPKKRPMLLEGFIPQRDITLLAGDSGLGKSSIARQFSISLVRGDETFCGLAINSQHRRVLYVSCEDGDETTAMVLAGVPGIPSDNLVFFFGSHLDLDTIVKEVERETGRRQYDLVVIDSILNVFEGSIGNGKHVSSFFKKFALVAKRASVLFLHHLRKDERKGEPRSGDILGSVVFRTRPRAVLRFSGLAPEKRRYLHMSKENKVSKQFLYDALVLDYDEQRDLYSATGEVVPTQDLENVLGSDTRKRDLGYLFESNETQLSTGILVKRIMDASQVSRRTAMDWLKYSNLEKIEHGSWGRPAVLNLVNDLGKVQ